MATIYYTSIDSPFGAVFAACNTKGISDLRLLTCEDEFTASIKLRYNRVVKEDNTFFKTLRERLISYFSGHKTGFGDIPVSPEGTYFDKDVWTALSKIPYGETRSYRWVAEFIGNPRVARAVGQSCGRNPIPIIIPCHRVIKTSGRLGGYSGGGKEVKMWLLKMENPKTLLFSIQSVSDS